MALIICTECEKEVSEKAGSCPHCGCPIVEGAPTHKKEKKKTSKLVGCLAIFFVLAVVSGIIEQFQDKDSSQTQYTGTTARKPAQRRIIKPIQVTARELYRAYKKNEVAADMKFKGKYVMIAGRIDNIGKDLLENMYVSLKSQRTRYQMIGFIQCYFSGNYKQQLATLSKGQKVVLFGKVSGKLGNILVKGCRLIQK